MELELFTLCHPVYSIEGVEYHSNFNYTETLDYHFDNNLNSIQQTTLKLKNICTSKAKPKSIMTDYLGLGSLVFNESLFDIVNAANTLDSAFIRTNLVTRKIKSQAYFVFLYNETPEKVVDYSKIIFNVKDFKREGVIDQIVVENFSQYYNVLTKLRREGKYLKFSTIYLKGNVENIINLDIQRFKLGGSHLFSENFVKRICEKVSDIKFERTRVKYLYGFPH